MINLTELWRKAHVPNGKRPAEWLRMYRKRHQATTTTREGRLGATMANSEVANAYRRYLKLR